MGNHLEAQIRELIDEGVQPITLAELEARRGREGAPDPDRTWSPWQSRRRRTAIIALGLVVIVVLAVALATRVHDDNQSIRVPAADEPKELDLTLPPCTDPPPPTVDRSTYGTTPEEDLAFGRMPVGDHCGNTVGTIAWPADIQAPAVPVTGADGTTIGYMVNGVGYIPKNIYEDPRFDLAAFQEANGIHVITSQTCANATPKSENYDLCQGLAEPPPRATTTTVPLTPQQLAVLPRTVTGDGFGAARFGATVSEASSALGADLTTNAAMCVTIPWDPYHSTLGVHDGRLSWFATSDPDVVTIGGLHGGLPLSAVYDAFPTATIEQRASGRYALVVRDAQGNEYDFFDPNGDATPSNPIDTIQVLPAATASDPAITRLCVSP